MFCQIKIVAQYWSEANLPQLASCTMETHSSVVYVFALHHIPDAYTSLLCKNTSCGIWWYQSGKSHHTVSRKPSDQCALWETFSFFCQFCQQEFSNWMKNDKVKFTMVKSKRELLCADRGTHNSYVLKTLASFPSNQSSCILFLQSFVL